MGKRQRQTQRRTVTYARVVATVGVVLSMLVGGGTAAAVPPPTPTAAPYPVPYQFLASAAAVLLSGDADPPGANNWTCRPSQIHPNPVVLVHGLLANKNDNWQTYAPLLATTATASLPSLTASFPATNHRSPSSQGGERSRRARKNWPASSPRFWERRVRRRSMFSGTRRAASCPTITPSSSGAPPRSTST